MSRHVSCLRHLTVSIYIIKCIHNTTVDGGKHVNHASLQSQMCVHAISVSWECQTDMILRASSPTHPPTSSHTHPPSPSHTPTCPPTHLQLHPLTHPPTSSHMEMNKYPPCIHEVAKVLPPRRRLVERQPQRLCHAVQSTGRWHRPRNPLGHTTQPCNQYHTLHVAQQAPPAGFWWHWFEQSQRSNRDLHD